MKLISWGSFCALINGNCLYIIINVALDKPQPQRSLRALSRPEFRQTFMGFALDAGQLELWSAEFPDKTVQQIRKYGAGALDLHANKLFAFCSGCLNVP
ncbi:hypothetical protein RRG08_034938 [Elysia crispata]|uniref:Uncharacterized protein n=1 Tax=Elysia crispata TaxID=231223 RepID=A0AAE1CR47_9GAST|nr:hypothetical protein RRG08_034938 [Elysia crispata]